MGERRSDDGGRARRHVHPDDSALGPGGGPAGTALETLLAAAMRDDGVDAAGEKRAVAAFRTARDTGAHRARTRRRDDWRPHEPWRARRSLKATVTMALASLTLGGVAVAAIGTVHSSHDGHDGTLPAGPTPTAPDTSAVRPSGAAPGEPGRTGPSERPSTAQDTEAHCRDYEKAEDHGKTMDATAWQRLIRAAGGETNVAAYCAQQLSQAATGDNSVGSSRTKNPGDTGNSGNGDSGRAKSDKGN